MRIFGVVLAVPSRVRVRRAISNAQSRLQISSRFAILNSSELNSHNCLFDLRFIVSFERSISHSGVVWPFDLRYRSIDFASDWVTVSGLQTPYSFGRQRYSGPASDARLRCIERCLQRLDFGLEVL